MQQTSTEINNNIKIPSFLQMISHSTTPQQSNSKTNLLKSNNKNSSKKYNFYFIDSSNKPPDGYPTVPSPLISENLHFKIMAEVIPNLSMVVLFMVHIFTPIMSSHTEELTPLPICNHILLL